MEINENTYILGYWFANHGDHDWYLMMVKQDGEWKGQQTFRHNKGDGDPFIDLDRDDKSIYDIKIKKEMSEEEIIDSIDEVFNFIKIKYNDYNDRFLVQGDIKKFMDIAKTKHYIHLKQVQ